MNAPMLNTFQQQRDYIIDKLGINTPLTRDTLERIEGEVSFSRLHKLEVSISQEDEALVLTPNSVRVAERIAELKQAITDELSPIPDILKAIKIENGERAIRDTRTREILATAIDDVNKLCDELNANARKYQCRQLEALSNDVRDSIKR